MLFFIDAANENNIYSDNMNQKVLETTTLKLSDTFCCSPCNGIADYLLGQFLRLNVQEIAMGCCFCGQLTLKTNIGISFSVYMS